MKKPKKQLTIPGTDPQPRAATVTDDEARAIAAKADVHVNSVWKRLGGGHVRGRVLARIDKAIEEWRAAR